MRRLSFAIFLILIGCTAVQNDQDHQNGLAPIEAAIHSSREQVRELSPPREGEVFHFVVFGDRTGGPKEGINVLADAVEETNLLDPDFVMTLGDLIQGYNETRQWLKQMREYKKVMSGLHMPWYPVAGNHDVYWRGDDTPPGHHEANYETHFGPLWYWFPHKNAAFIVLYTDEGDRETNRKGFSDPNLIQMSFQQLDWLKATLNQTARFDHVFVFMHHPRWIGDYYQGGNWEEAHRLLAEAGNVSAVFAGHFHQQRYEGRRDGILYYRLATVGGGLRMNVPASGLQHHFDQVTVREDGFEIASVPVGALYDPKDLTPAFVRDIEKARKLPIVSRTPKIELGIEGDAVGTVKYGIKNTTTRPIEVSVHTHQAPGDWLARPSRAEFSLQPGESKDVEVSLERPGDGFLTPFSIPNVVFQVDYLADHRRIALPERSFSVPVTPLALPYPPGPPPQEKAMWLEGDGSGLWIANEAFEMTSQTFTIEARFKSSNLSGDRVLVGKYDGKGFALVVSDGRPRLVGRLGDTRLNLRAPKSERAELGRWHHLAAVSSPAGTHLYLDGKVVASSEVAGPIIDSALPLIIGGNAVSKDTAGSFFSGAIDEVRISSVARYEEGGFRPPLRFEPDGDTALLLHLDRDEGPFALDASPHRRHAIGIGTVNFRPF